MEGLGMFKPTDLRTLGFLFWTLLDLVTFPSGVRSNQANLVGRLVYAVNAGGPAHSDLDGIFYEADPCQEGISSDYGKRFWTIGRVDPADAILYQTERYGMTSFGYKIPVRDDGDYVLVLKFSEVYFLNPRKKVFDVFLNKVHQIVKDLDIFDKVGHGVAHDEIVPFSVSNKGQTLRFNGGTSKIRDKSVQLQFIKGDLDNPKINAFYVIRGTAADVPMLPPYDPTDADLETDVSSELDLDMGHDEETSVEDDTRYIPEQSSIDDTLLSQRAKRRRRLVQRPVVRDVDVYPDDWSGYIQVGGSLGIALLVAFAIKKIIA